MQVRDLGDNRMAGARRPHVTWFRAVVAAGLVSAVAAPALAQTPAAPPSPPRPVHTYSIVARDTATGEIGAAVQSHWFAVGATVIHAEAGVGAVATQSFIDPSYGPLGLGLMRAGRSAPDALAGLLAADQGRAVRQVAFIDRTGTVAAWTGGRDIQHAGHVVGPGAAGAAGSTAAAPAHAPGLDPEDGRFTAGTNFSVQANLMASDRVWPEMARAFQQATGDLADRMLAAMEAAQAAGGDLRGRQSAGLVIVKAEASGRPWADRVFDLRVDDAEEPVRELRRLVALQRAYNHMNAGDLAMEHQDTEGALREYAAAERLAAGIEGVLPTRLAEMFFWHAVALVNIGRVEEALPLFEKAFAVQPGWREVVARLPAAGLVTADPAIVRRIVQLGERKD